MEYTLFQKTEKKTTVFDKIDSRFVDMETDKKIESARIDMEFKGFLERQRDILFQLQYVQKVQQTQEVAVQDMRLEMVGLNETLARNSEEFIKAIKRDGESNAYKFEQLQIRQTQMEIGQNQMVAKINT